ncbi:hypothetical protein X757_31775 [Mesorhizobium sp. LSHC414A00]|nr:hypothetical protein X757_31775 [Mesorhizobium sp. LSHC414A00]
MPKLWATCQSLVSQTLAKHDVPVPIVFRLFVPDTSIKDPELLAVRRGARDPSVERSKPIA